MTSQTPKYRLVPASIPSDAQCLQVLTFDGNYGSPLWRTIDTIRDPESAADRLAVCLGEMTEAEAAKRWRSRKRARKAA